MAKTSTKSTRRNEGYEVVGTTADGVKILRQVGNPKHFTREEMRETIRAFRERQRSEAVAAE